MTIIESEEITRKRRVFSFSVMPARVLPDGTKDPWWEDESNGFYESDLRRPSVVAKLVNQAEQILGQLDDS